MRPTPERVRAWLIDGARFPHGIHPEDASFWIDALTDTVLASALLKYVPIGAPGRPLNGEQRAAMNEAHARHQEARVFRPRASLDEARGYVTTSATWDTAAYLAAYCERLGRPEITEDAIIEKMQDVYRSRKQIGMSSCSQPLAAWLHDQGSVGTGAHLDKGGAQ